MRYGSSSRRMPTRVSRTVPLRATDRGYRTAELHRPAWLADGAIAPYLGAHTKSAFSIRLAQQAVGDATAAVATVVTQDLGDPQPAAREVHAPPRQVAVGARLAAAVGLGSWARSCHSRQMHLWGGPALASVTERTFRVHRPPRHGRRPRRSGRGLLDVFDDGTQRPASERCCDAPDTFQLCRASTQRSRRGHRRSSAAVNYTVVGTR